MAARIDRLNEHLNDHLVYMKTLIDEGILPISGPFFTADGKNTGNGFYVLKVDNLEEARGFTAEDPLHKGGIRTPSIEPWLQVLD